MFLGKKTIEQSFVVGENFAIFVSKPTSAKTCLSSAVILLEYCLMGRGLRCTSHLRTQVLVHCPAYLQLDTRCWTLHWRVQTFSVTKQVKIGLIGSPCGTPHPTCTCCVAATPGMVFVTNCSMRCSIKHRINAASAPLACKGNICHASRTGFNAEGGVEGYTAGMAWA